MREAVESNPLADIKAKTGFNPEDESMEILEDSGLEAGEEAPATEPVIEEDGSLVIDATAPTEDDTYVDNNGRRRSKTTGRYV